MQKKESQIHTKSQSLTQSVWNYLLESFPPLSYVTTESIQWRVDQFVQKKVPPNKPGFIAFLGPPGVGKSSNVPRIQDAVHRALWFRRPQEHITYSHPDGNILEVGWYLCEESNTIVTTLHADHFFRALGADRREVMLQDAVTCRKLWWNPRAALRFIRDLYAGESTDVRIYTGTVDEKILKEPKGIIELKIHPEVDTKKVIIAEWVNVGEWADTIKKKTSIKTLKILYNMSVEDSLIRVLRRDHDKKWYPFQDILQARLLEYYYIFELYLLPALRDPKTVLFNKSREIPLFSHDEKREILAALYTMQAKYLRSDSTLSREQKQFIDILSSRVIAYFHQSESLSPEVFAQRKFEKLQKKAAALRV